jgi:RimJ/RimL family protein N-acetyltransferase
MRDGEQPTLELSPRLRIRPWTGSDAAALVSAFSHPEIRYWHMRELSSPEEARAWIASWFDRWNAETDAGWAVVDPETGELRGQVAIRSLNLEFGHGQITYWTRPGFRGEGTASKATGAVARWALEELELHRLEIRHSTRNDASCRVAERAGFELEGVTRSALLHEDGWHDMHVHAQLREPS